MLLFKQLSIFDQQGEEMTGRAMHILKNHPLIRRSFLLFLILLFSHCAWFKSEPVETTWIKPTPVNGYADLGTRIFYPKDLREKGVEGTVVLKANISTEGLVTEVRVIQKLDPELDKIAANAIQRTLFNPALKDGAPVAVWISIPIQFALKDWATAESPFEKFEMVVKPDQSYQRFEVTINGQLKPEASLPMRFELLLPYNVEKSWVRSGDTAIEPLTMNDQSGEWLIFQADAPELHLGFNYLPISQTDKHKFVYKFSLNQALPEWQLIIIYGNQPVQFVQSPDRITEGPDGAQRFTYNLDKQSAYETKYLEVSLVK